MNNVCWGMGRCWASVGRGMGKCEGGMEKCVGVWGRLGERCGKVGREVWGNILGC